MYENSNHTDIQSSKGQIKAWMNGVQFEDIAIEQLKNVADMPFVKPYVAAMPDTHWGMGCTVGSVVPTVGAIMPAAVGVDIGCGMMAVLTNADKNTFKDHLPELRKSIENAIPHGRTNDGKPGDRGAWGNIPNDVQQVWNEHFHVRYEKLCKKHPGARSKNAVTQLGTLGTGNHFIEVALDEQDRVWFVLHSGSRGLGNRIGQYFTKLAKETCVKKGIELVDQNLAYLEVGDSNYDDYIEALHLAQDFALANRRTMMFSIFNVVQMQWVRSIECHHNYMSLENHFGQDVILTRKGAVDASTDKMVIIPGSMGARTYIARGLGSSHSFRSCSHGAGRAMGRKAAIRDITPEQHLAALQGIECHSGPETIDESPAAYKSIDAVMAAQTDLVEPVHILRQIVNVKGWEK